MEIKQDIWPDSKQQQAIHGEGEDGKPVQLQPGEETEQIDDGDEDPLAGL